MSIDLFIRYIFYFFLTLNENILNENFKNNTDNIEFRRELLDLILD